MALLDSGLGGATQTAGLSNEFKTFYNRSLLENARAVRVHAQFGKEYQLPKNIGNTMEWRKATPLANRTTPLQEGVTPADDTFAYTNQTVSIAQYGSVIRGTDIVQLTNFDPLLDDVAEEQGFQAGYSMEAILAAVLVAGTTVQYANGRASRITVAAGDVITSNEIVKARRTLKINLAPPWQAADYAAVIHPMTEADVLRDSSIVTAMNAGSTTGGNKLFDGEIGRYMGVRFAVSTLAQVFTGAGAAGIDVYATLFFGKNSFGIVELSGATMEHIFHPVGSAGGADPLNQYWTSGWKCTYACKILQQAFMLRLEHAVGA